MKKPIITITLAALLTPGIFLTGCKSPSQKAEDAKENVADAREDLKDAKQDENTAVVRAANEQEWKAFKIDTEAKIEKNKLRISELKTKHRTEADKRKIDALEKKNDELENQMNMYEKDKGDWATFTRDFNRNMDELGNSLTDESGYDKK